MGLFDNHPVEGAFCHRFRAGLLRLVIYAAGFIWAVEAGGAEDYSDWTGIADLQLNTTPSGANVTGRVTRFPILVRLDAGNFDFARARGKGQDIRFSTAAGKPLPHQVERWDSARGRAEIWVLADTVHGNRDDQVLRMYWGNPVAPDIGSASSVFEASNGFLAVYHMGGTGARPNAVSDYHEASVHGYAGDESVPGVIGYCDSLDSKDYLSMQDGFQELAGGFTFSVWAYPTSTGYYARFLNLGSGPGVDNVIFGRELSTDNLYVGVYDGTLRSDPVSVPGGISTGVWQHFAVTVSGTTAKVYRNGTLLQQQALTQAISGAQRTSNFIGKSSWTSNEIFQGKLDEPRISKVARSADWIRLSWANQAPNQKFLTMRKQEACIPAFEAPADTSLPEGRLLELSGRADCASFVTWSAVSGPAPRILDPDVMTLQTYMPRVVGNTTLVYRFLARFGDAERTRDIRVEVLESIPDPDFNLAALPAWNGAAPLLVRPTILNLAAIRASRDSILEWEWSVSGPAVDTLWQKDALALSNPTAAGAITVGLCLNNHGPKVCKETTVQMHGTLGLSRKAPATTDIPVPRYYRNAAGRLVKAGGPMAFDPRRR